MSTQEHPAGFIRRVLLRYGTSRIVAVCWAHVSFGTGRTDVRHEKRADIMDDEIRHLRLGKLDVAYRRTGFIRNHSAIWSTTVEQHRNAVLAILEAPGD